MLYPDVPFYIPLTLSEKKSLLCLPSAAVISYNPARWSTYKLSMFMMSPKKPYEWKLFGLDERLKPGLTSGYVV